MADELLKSIQDVKRQREKGGNRKTEMTDRLQNSD